MGVPIEIMMVNIGHHSWEVVMSYDINQDGIYHGVIQNIINGRDVSWNENCIVMTFLVRECYGSPKKQEF